MCERVDRFVMAMSCPLCCQSISVDLLRTSLISVINRPLICPICGDVQRSLVNLAAHLTQHIEVPSQIGHSEPQCDANNVIHNININNTTACDESVANQSEVERKCDGNMTEKLDAPSLSPVSVHELESSEQSRITTTPIDQIVQPFICNLCECSFRSQELHQMHMQLVHEINIRPSNEDSKLVSDARAISSSMLQCYLCPKRFKMIGSLRLHVRMVHGVSHVPQNVRTQNTLICETTSNNNLVASTGSELVMETGDLIASAPSSHVSPTNRSLVHNNLSDYYSNYGLNDGTFGTNSGGTNGGNSSGSEQQDYDGPSNGNNNSKEMSIVNTDDRIHKCDICNKRFTTKYFLKKHKRLHTGKNLIGDNFASWNVSHCVISNVYAFDFLFRRNAVHMRAMPSNVYISTVISSTFIVSYEWSAT